MKNLRWFSEHLEFLFTFRISSTQLKIILVPNTVDLYCLRIRYFLKFVCTLRWWLLRSFVCMSTNTKLPMNHCYLGKYVQTPQIVSNFKSKNCQPGCFICFILQKRKWASEVLRDLPENGPGGARNGPQNQKEQVVLHCPLLSPSLNFLSVVFLILVKGTFLLPKITQVETWTSDYSLCILWNNW